MRIIAIPAGLLCWILITLFHIYNQIRFEVFTEYQVPEFGMVYNLVVLCFYIFNGIAVFSVFEKNEKFNVVSIFWQQFIIGSMGLAWMFVLILGAQYLKKQTSLNFVNPLTYSICWYLITVFFFWSVAVFRRFLLYQKNTQKVRLWNFIRICMGVALLLTANIGGLQVYEPTETSKVALLIFGLFSLFFIIFFLSSGLRLSGQTDVGWAYQLTSGQKLKTLGLLLLLFICFILYGLALNTIGTLFSFYNRHHEHFDILIVIIIFGLSYTGFSMLVLFFNLPASSVFEVKNTVFNKINQAILTNLDSPEIYTTLLNGGILLSDADTGWIEVINEKDASRLDIVCFQGVKLEEIPILAPNNVFTHQVLIDKKPYLVKKMTHNAKNPDIKFQSLLCVPIYYNQNHFGALILMKKYANAFEEFTINTVNNLAEQTGAALEHIALVKKSIELERYHEQLKIAKEFQLSLLPRQIPELSMLDIAVVNEYAEEIGGDFYDFDSNVKSTLKMAIGDVSGHGTTAAFYMAVAKGIFQALTRQHMPVTDFMIHANEALCRSLQKGIFVTMTYIEINLDKKEIEYLRAGHCPTIFYDSLKGQVIVNKAGSPGLGIIRNNSYSGFVKNSEEISYNPGDILVLLTDGILEAKNKSGEEFGIGRVCRMIEAQRESSARTIAESIRSAVFDFSQKRTCDDDMTVCIIKFTG
ncbi:MAG: SpoIIE family protein phosphatase [Bacteroidia bacterium]|nr:SpoIIE family protein phosphatase [Bacteroidia bacterium]